MEARLSRNCFLNQKKSRSPQVAPACVRLCVCARCWYRSHADARFPPAFGERGRYSRAGFCLKLRGVERASHHMETRLFAPCSWPHLFDSPQLNLIHVGWLRAGCSPHWAGEASRAQLMNGFGGMTFPVGQRAASGGAPRGRIKPLQEPCSTKS